jgi:hypothetical protein
MFEIQVSEKGRKRKGKGTYILAFFLAQPGSVLHSSSSSLPVKAYALTGVGFGCRDFGLYVRSRIGSERFLLLGVGEWHTKAPRSLSLALSRRISRVSLESVKPTFEVGSVSDCSESEPEALLRVRKLKVQAPSPAVKRLRADTLSSTLQPARLVYNCNCVWNGIVIFEYQRRNSIQFIRPRNVTFFYNALNCPAGLPVGC